MIRLSWINAPEGVRSFTSPKRDVTLGRGEANDVILKDKRISAHHGQIVRRGSRTYYQDLMSTNGSMVRQGERDLVVDGREVPQVEIGPGDILLLGDRSLPVIVRVEAIEEGLERGEETVLVSRVLGLGPDLGPVVARDPGLLKAFLLLVQEVAYDRNPMTIVVRVGAFLLENIPRASLVSLVEPALQGGWREAIRLPREGPVTDEPRPLDPQAWLPSPSSDMVEVRRSDQGVQIMAPLQAPGESLGFLRVQGHAGGLAFDQEDVDLVTLMAFLTAASLSRANLLSRLERAEERLTSENLYLKDSLARTSGFGPLIGSSAAMQRVYQQIERVAATDTTVLIMGETGTGKELVARSIHDRSHRKDRIFAAVNCGAITESLLESELFGHVKGAFTGAVSSRKGLFLTADGGTLFLDEIGEMPLHLQVKLLRALESGEVWPVGGSRAVRVDVRTLSASNRELDEEVKAGRFRRDLFYRLHVFPIRLPPLRERQGDVGLLARHFLEQSLKKGAKGPVGLSEAALIALESYPFPGNVRELKNEIERAMLMAPVGGMIEVVHLSDALAGPEQENREPTGTLRQALEQFEQRYMMRVLEEKEWNRTQTAKALGISRQAFMAKLSKYGIRKPD